MKRYSEEEWIARSTPKSHSHREHRPASYMNRGLGDRFRSRVSSSADRLKKEWWRIFAFVGTFPPSIQIEGVSICINMNEGIGCHKKFSHILNSFEIRPTWDSQVLYLSNRFAVYSYVQITLSSWPNIEIGFFLGRPSWPTSELRNSGVSESEFIEIGSIGG